MSRPIAVWIEVPQTVPAGGTTTSRPERPRLVRLTVATAAEPPAPRYEESTDLVAAPAG
jgi:hypothetical protein